jgi:hypothetical protein
MRKRIASLFPAFERPALPVLPRRSPFSSPCSWTTSLSYAHHPRGCLHGAAWLILAGTPPSAWQDHNPEQRRSVHTPYRVPGPWA